MLYLLLLLFEHFVTGRLRWDSVGVVRRVFVRLGGGLSLVSLKLPIRMLFGLHGRLVIQ